MYIYLAPMEGITTFIYRNAFNRCYGGIDKYFTPFISHHKLNHRELSDILPENNKDIFLVPQILTNKSTVFLEIAKTLAEYGYKEINLNLGCPSGTVVSKNRGAGFLRVPEELDSFLDEIFNACPLDISIKTRIGIESTEEWNRLLKIFSSYPIKELIIHPRLQKEFYSGSPHIEAYETAKSSLKIPVCYNGDITTAPLSDCLSDSERIMAGRGVLKNPLLPLILKGDTTKKCSFAEFHREILEGYKAFMPGSKPVLFHMKELWTYMYAFGGLSEKHLKKLKKTNSLTEYECLVNSFIKG